MGGVRDAAVWSHSVSLCCFIFIVRVLSVGMIDWAVGGWGGGRG
jgi:hypothetical protein